MIIYHIDISSYQKRFRHFFSHRTLISNTEAICLDFFFQDQIKVLLIVLRQFEKNSSGEFSFLVQWAPVLNLSFRISLLNILHSECHSVEPTALNLLPILSLLAQ